MSDAPDSTAPQPVVDRLLASRDALFSDAVPGLGAARELAALADDAVASLAAAAERVPPGRWALIALGGYGAGRLLPASDIDLLVASDAPPAQVRPFAEAVFYPLWDAGLAVGHQVRSRGAQRAECAADPANLTASLTGRVVAGDIAFGDDLLAAVARRARRSRRRVLAHIAARVRADSPFLLEADLKEGAGGQRDLDEMAWTAAVLSGMVTRDQAALVPLGLLETDEAEALDVAADRLMAARWLLHLAGQSRRNLLSPDAAEDLPLDLEALTASTADVSATLSRVRRRVARVPEPSPPATPAALFALLDEGACALPRLEEAAWAGDLDALLPGLRSLMTVRRPGLSHTRTVGAHCLAAAALVADTGASDPFAAAALRGLDDRRPVLAAALTHDAGKREGGPGHAERGVTAARTAAARLGLAECADDVALLVREHLLLAKTASTEDPRDEDAVLRVAARIGRRDLVAPLHVLTVADTLATRADLWSPWRAAVTGELVARLDAALADDVEGAGIARDAAATRTAALALVTSDDPALAAFVEGAPLRYLASTPPAVVAMHAALAAPLTRLTDPTAAAVSVGLGPAEGTWRVTVATRDRPGLFATLAGTLALTGLSILGADALPGPSGTVIDVFTVESATAAAVDPATWAAFERAARAALAGRLNVALRLGERRRHYPPGRSGVPVTVTSDASRAFATVVNVRAPDRAGLLYDLARTFGDAKLDIRSASVMTLDGVATDAFRVVDESGHPPADASVLADLTERLGLAARPDAT